MIIEQKDQVILSGTIGRIETKTVGDNKKLTQFGVVVNETIVKNESTGKDDHIAVWENVDCWGKVSQLVQNYKKGDIVFVTGKRLMDTYKNKAGEEVESKKVSASFVLKLGAEAPKYNGNETKKSAEPTNNAPIDNSDLPF